MRLAAAEALIRAVLLACAMALAVSATPDAGPAADAGVPDPSKVVLAVGVQRVLSVGEMRGVAVATPAILDVRVLGPSELLLVGLAAGRSDLTVFHVDGEQAVYRVEVAATEALAGACAPCGALPDSPELRVELAGDRFFVTGLIGSLEDYARLRSFPRVVLLAKLDPKLVAARVAQVNEALARAGLRNVKAVLRGASTLAIEGAVAGGEESKEAHAIARSLFEPVGRAIDDLARGGGP